MAMTWVLIDSGSGLLHARHQAITWTNGGLLSIGQAFTQYNLYRSTWILKYIIELQSCKKKLKQDNNQQIPKQ